MDIQDNQPMRVIEGLLRVFKPSTNPQRKPSAAVCRFSLPLWPPCTSAGGRKVSCMPLAFSQAIHYPG